MFSTYFPIDIPEFSCHHVTFLLTNPFQYPTINIRNHVWVHWFDWCEGLLELLNVKRHPSKKRLTYKVVSVCKFSHRRTCLYLSPNFSCFISTNMFPHKAVVYETWSCACSHTESLCLHTCWLTKTCLCVTFNISHRVFHLWPTCNDGQPYDFNLQNLLSMQILSYETMPENTDLTNTEAVRRVHCKHSYIYETFLTCEDVSVYNVWHASPCLCSVSNIISHPFT